MTFVLTMLFMSLVFWRPQEWLMPWLFGWPILDIIVYGSLVTMMLEVNSGQLRIPIKAPQLYLLAGLWFASIMSHVANTYFVGMMETIPETFKTCFFTALLLCVLDRPSRFRAVAWVFVTMTCVMAVHALLQQKLGAGFAGQPPIVTLRAGGTEPEVRSLFFGIFSDPNDLAQILATSIPLAFGLFRRGSLIGPVVGGLSTWLLVSAILATHSRGGYIALVAVGAIMFVLVLPSRWLPFMMLLLLGAALLLCPLSAGYLDISAHDRVVFWGMANQMFKAHPIFGIGYGMFWQVASDRASHNAFVSCYTTIGVFGYWFWFGLLQLSVISAWRTRIAFNRPQTEEQAWFRRFAGLCIASVGGYCASAYFLTRDFVYPLFFLFALLGALTIVAQRLLPDDHPPLISFGRHVMAMGTIGTLVSIVYVYFSILMLNRAFYG